MAYIKVDLESNLVDIDASTPQVATCFDMVLHSVKKHLLPNEFMSFKYTMVHSLLFHFFTDEEVIDCMQKYERLQARLKGKTDEK